MVGGLGDWGLGGLGDLSRVVLGRGIGGLEDLGDGGLAGGLGYQAPPFDGRSKQLAPSGD